MDTEFENKTSVNNTDVLYFNPDPTAWDYLEDSIALFFTCVGLLANYVIIYIVARNMRMRTKTNIILMNLAINDTFYLICNLHFLASFLQLMGANINIPFFHNCIVRFMDIGFELNAVILILILISNTFMKSKRIQVKWLLIGIYTITVGNFFLHIFYCNFDMFPIQYHLCFLLMAITLGILLFKEFNNCYKKWYKKDPLSSRTLFRLNIGLIYSLVWIVSFFLYPIASEGMRYFWYTVALHGNMSSMYILIYIVYADKKFRICLLNMLRCKGAGDYDVDATITFSEENSNDGPGNNQANIHLNDDEDPIRTQVQDISTRS